MTHAHDAAADRREIDRLMAEFFHAVSFEPGGSPPYEDIRALFVEGGLLIRNSGTVPEISTVPQFIEPRRALVASGNLTRFREAELSATTEVFGNVAQRFSAYAKDGSANGVAFAARGMIATQFVRTPGGWKMSAMAWDDEREGLVLPASRPWIQEIPS